MAVIISVIVPVYNVQDYLSACVDSLLNQSYKEYEIILVNDGSTDFSGKICQKYSDKYEKVRVIHKKNGGLSSARNAGIRAAYGLFLAFVDSDDVVHPDYLKHMYMLAISYHADLVCCDFIKGKNCQWESEESFKIKQYQNNEILEGMYEQDVVKTVIWNKLYRKELFLTHEIWFPVGRIHEDMYVTPQIFFWAKRMIVTNRKLYFYRIREGSITNSAFSERNMQVLDAIEFRLRYLKAIHHERLYQKELEGYVRKLYELFRRTNTKEYQMFHKKIQMKANRIRLGSIKQVLSAKSIVKLLIMRCKVLDVLHE